MQTLHVESQSGRDGVLHLEIPVGTAEAEFEVLVVYQPKHANGRPRTSTWPPGFIEATAGSIADDTFVRQPQGKLPSRMDFE